MDLRFFSARSKTKRKKRVGVVSVRSDNFWGKKMKQRNSGYSKSEDKDNIGNSTKMRKIKRAKF